MGILEEFHLDKGVMEFDVRRGEQATMIEFKRRLADQEYPDEVVLWIPTEAFEAFQELVADPDKVIVSSEFFHHILGPEMKERRWTYIYHYLVSANHVSVYGVRTPGGAEVTPSILKDLVKVLKARQGEEAG